MYSGNPLGTINPVRAMRAYVPGGSALSVKLVSVKNNFFHSSQWISQVFTFKHRTFLGIMGHFLLSLRLLLQL